MRNTVYTNGSKHKRRNRKNTPRSVGRTKQIEILHRHSFPPLRSHEEISTSTKGLKPDDDHYSKVKGMVSIERSDRELWDVG